MNTNVVSHLWRNISTNLFQTFWKVFFWTEFLHAVKGLIPYSLTTETIMYIDLQHFTQVCYYIDKYGAVGFLGDDAQYTAKLYHNCVDMRGAPCGKFLTDYEYVLFQ